MAKVSKGKKMAKTTTSKVQKPSRWRGIFSRQINLWLAVVVVVAAGTAGVYYNRQSHADVVGTGCTRGIWNVGDSGGCVYNLQKTLNALYSGYNTSADGIFGPDTKRLVMSFQNKVNAYFRQFGWPNQLTVDGVVGPHTWSYICNPPGPTGYIFPSNNDDRAAYYKYSRAAGCY